MYIYLPMFWVNQLQIENLKSRLHLLESAKEESEEALKESINEQAAKLTALQEVDMIYCTDSQFAHLQVGE